MLKARGFHLLVMMLIWVSAGLTSSGAAAQTQPIKVGLYQNAPMVFLDDANQPAGFFPDLLNYIAAEEQWTLEYVACELNECLLKVEDGTLDLMMDVAFSRKRTGQFDFNLEVVLANWSTLYVAPNSDIQSIEDMHKRKIAVVKGSNQHALFQEWPWSSGVHPEFIEVAGFRQVFEYIEEGKADGGLVNRLFGVHFEQDYNVERTNEIMAPSQLHFIVLKGKNLHLIEAIDRHMAQLKADDASVYYQAVEKWVVSEEARVLPYWLKGLLILFGLVLIVALSFVVALRWQVNKKTATLKRMNATLHTLTAMNETLIRSHTEQEVLDDICRAAIQQGDFFMAAVGFVDRDEAQSIKFAALQCVGKCGASDWSDISSVTEALKTVIQTGQPTVGRKLHGGDVAELPCVLKLKASSRGLCTITVFPLIVERRPIGAFCLCSDTVDIFTKDMVQLLTQMADDLAFGIQNIRDTQLRLAMNKRIQQADKMDALGDLAGGVAHDLKNMLFPIISLTQMTLKELPEDSRAHKRLEKVVEAAERASSLTETIHAFSHTDTGIREQVNVCDLIDNCLDMLRPAMPSSIDIVVACNINRDAAEINVDTAQFQTMLLNLSSNASDAIGGNTGTIHISSTGVRFDTILPMDIPVPKPGTYIKLEFLDSGSGMDEEARNHIFEPYFTTKVRGKGVGLGMSMVQKFVVEHDGGISVSSKQGMGTVFEIYLPIVETPIHA